MRRPPRRRASNLPATEPEAMPTETPDLLDRLQAVNPAVGDDPAPAWEDTRRRLAPAPRTTWRPRRALVLGAAVAAVAVTATFIVDSGDAPRQAPLGVLEAAAATAVTDARFSGYTAETHVDIRTPDGPGTDDTSWTIVRPVSSTEYEARMESLRPVPKEPIEPPRGRPSSPSSKAWSGSSGAKATRSATSRAGASPTGRCSRASRPSSPGQHGAGRAGPDRPGRGRRRRGRVGRRPRARGPASGAWRR